ncbi:imidazole glycerol phosphate synthase cyclase subunit [Rhizobium sp. CNPSo 3490]|uniref:imidazole glycerol phosphate synthase subunit HisF n=1 Tax=Rhizobium sp. CNPSo 3490 TaxID=3021407 RepID=UPI00254EFD40|nr:imidazole glycerol phosphate synthase cyclase subunit [Rhizobium sp. CNPSo 3490]MDK4736474.1 imidazole glycerol phosphate synthase cyclase subunit [Rhizobium sp. CNPSo 3490]
MAVAKADRGWAEQALKECRHDQCSFNSPARRQGSEPYQGEHLEGLRVLGDPGEFAKKFYDQGADEIIYMDIVASLYGRSNLVEIVRKTTEDVFIPVTVGGGIRTVDDVQELLDSGADKVAINTAAANTPELITRVSERFGSQCMVLSIEAKRQPDGSWKAYTDNGRERTNLDVVEWAQRGVELGAGEILLTSIDREGTRKGYDIELTAKVTQAVNIPVIASGGMGNIDHLVSAVRDARADGVAMADVLHYGRLHLDDIRPSADRVGIKVRKHAYE